MKTYQIVTVDDKGTTTQKIPAPDMTDAIHRALGNLKTKHLTSITTVTCTTL